MNGVPFVCIDPHLLSLPQVERSSTEDVEDFVSAVVDWARTADGRCTTAFISSGVLDAIDADRAFPWKSDLLRILKHFRVQSADPETVATAVRALLNSARIDETIDINAVLLDSPRTTVAPTFLQERLRPQTQAAFADQLAMIVLAQDFKEMDPVALGSIPDGNEKPTLSYISFATEIADIDWRSEPSEVAVNCPYAVDEKISVFFSRNGLLEKFEPVSLWPASYDAVQARNAIDCCIARLVASGTSDRRRLRYEIGPRFIQSAAQWECGQSGRHNFTLIESCARLVLNIPKHDIGVLLDNETGKHKVRADGAVACRTHVTKRGVGLRLMFWKLQDGTIEFANIGDKDELVIQ